MKITPIDGNIETEGSICVYRGVKLKVARSGNTEFKRVFRAAMKPFREELDGGRMSEEQSSKLMIECAAKTILVGWEAFAGMDGKKYEYSYANAVELLTDDPDCYDAVMKHSENIENYLMVEQEKLKVK